LLRSSKKKQKDSFNNNNNPYYFVEANLKAKTLGGDRLVSILLAVPIAIRSSWHFAVARVTKPPPTPLERGTLGAGSSKNAKH
jgi:hypothetical protein